MLDARRRPIDALMRDGRPNAELFDTVVGGVMERMTAARPGARVHAYGEMVDLLCRAGDADGALALEELWNGLATRYQFALFCAYVMEGLLPTSEQARARVCDAHGKVIDARGSFEPRFEERQRLRDVAHAHRLSEVRSFHLLVDSVVDYAIFMLDCRGVVRTWNAGAQRIIGYHADEIVGHHFSCFHPSHDVRRGNCEALLSRVARESRVQERGWRLRKDGSSFLASVTITALRAPNGDLVGFAKITRDLTEVQRADEERLALLNEAQARVEAERVLRLLAVLQQVTPRRSARLRLPQEIGTIMVDAGARAVGADLAVFGRFEGAQLEVTTQSGTLTSRVDRSTPFGLACGDGKMRWLEPDDVTRYAPSDFFPVRGAAAIVPLVADGRVLAVVGYGFAPGVVVGPEERSLVQTLAGQAAQAFDRAQALALAEAANRVKDEFLASVSHEIRTPLTSILGWSSILLKNKTVQDTMVLKGLETIHRAAHAQIKLVDDLLDLARVVSGKLTVDRQRLDIVALVAGAVDIARPNAATKGVTLTSELGHEPVFVDADGDRFQQVVLNLLTNAVKFTDVGGSVAVVLSRTPTVVTLSVCDTGRGIAPDLLPYVFERFRQGEGTSARAGLGLGLAIAKHIVGLHGGTIQASSDGPDAGPPSR